MKTKFGWAQFLNQNTPALMQKIGNIGLIFSTLAVMIWGLPVAMQEAGFTDFVLPAILAKSAKVCAAIGVLVKFISKFWGVIDGAGNPANPHQK